MASLQHKMALAAGPLFKIKNKDKRAAAYLKHKKARESLKRDERLRRRREEDKNPRLRVERRAKNVPVTQDQKRVWDEMDDAEGEGLGLSVDLTSAKRQKTVTSSDADGLTEDKLKKLAEDTADEEEDDEDNENDDDLESLMDDLDDEEEEKGEDDKDNQGTLDGEEDKASRPTRKGSPAPSSASTNLSLLPDALAAKFPTLFKPPAQPKVLITTSLNGTVHHEASLLTSLFPNSHYVPRTRHRYDSHHFSVREIAKYASNRDYTSLVILEEDLKRPSGLTFVHLPAGPTFHFSMTNWVEGKKLPGHGKPTDHRPELLLNNFKTPLGLLTACLFRSLFPAQPDFDGRQVVTLLNQRDYIFVRRHRYVFRDKRQTERSVTAADGNAVQGVEDIRAGLQELGPRFTLKLRRVDKGVQRGSGQEWQWKGGMEKQRTKFAL